MLNVLKMSGWSVYLSLKVLDILWISTISPFLDAQVASYRLNHRNKRKQKLLKHIKQTTTEDNFGKNLGKIFDIMKDKK